MPTQGLGPATSGLWKDYVLSDPSDNKWQQILDFLGARLAEISTSIGYKTDIGENVFYDRPTPLESTEIPGIVYSADIQSGEGAAIGSFRWLMNVEINIVASGSTAKATVNKAVTDVLKVIGVNKTMNQLATETRQPTVTPYKSDQKDHILSVVKITLPIVFDTERWTI